MLLKILVASGNRDLYDIVSDIVANGEKRLSLAGYAQDGELLLQHAQQYQPDIVILDMDLPIKNGLDCLRELKNNGFSGGCIMTSKMRNFDCLYEALKLGVDDYLLEPLMAVQLNTAITKVADATIFKLDTVIARDHSNAVRQLFVDKINTEVENLSPESLDEINRLYDTRFHRGNLFCVIFIVIDHQDGENLVFNIIPALQYKITSLVEEYLGKYCSDILFNLRFNEIMALLNYPRSEEGTVGQAYSRLLAALKSECSDAAALGISISVGKAYTDISKIKQSKEEAHYAAWTRQLLGTDKVLFWKDDEECPDYLKNKLDSLYRRLQRSCEILNIDDFRQTIKEFFELPKPVLNRHEAKIWVMSALDCFYKTNADLVESFADREQLYNKTKRLMLLSKSFDELEKIFISQLADVFMQIVETAEKKSTKPARRAIAYINEHYGAKISLEDVAGVANLSPAYFSQFFKRETGRNFSKYLTELRIEKAKNLLKISSLSIKEIAAEVGFSDQKYFCKSFKKHTGIVPTEYRQIKE